MSGINNKPRTVNAMPYKNDIDGLVIFGVKADGLLYHIFMDGNTEELIKGIIKKDKGILVSEEHVRHIKVAK